jgi:hypothetical protein
MRKHVILLYARELSTCPRYNRIFNSDFELITTGTERHFLENLQAKRLPMKRPFTICCVWRLSPVWFRS